MRVICPHCQTIYQIQDMEADAVLVCHRCGTEFSLGEKPEGALDVDASCIADEHTPDMFAAAPDGLSDRFEVTADSETIDTAGEDSLPQQPLSEEGMAANEPAAKSLGQMNFPQQADIPDSEQAADEESFIAFDQTDDPEPVIIPSRDAWPKATADDAERIVISESAEVEPREDSNNDPDFPSGPPPRARARIMPWLITVVLLIAGSGFWMNHEAWLNDPWLRSVLINAGVHMEIRDKDWKIDPDSVSAVWIERKAGETVLVITGEVRNLLQTRLMPPLIHVTLYARDNPDETITERDEIITRPPLMQAIRQAPYLPPPQDTSLITAFDKRGFVLVLENLPQNAGNFTLTAKAR